MYNDSTQRNNIVDIPAFVAEKVNEGLYQKGTFIHTVLDIVDALVAVCDRKGRIVLFNKACEAITGYSFDEIKGKPVWDLFILPEEKEQVFRFLEEVFSGNLKFPVTHVNHWQSRDGSKSLIAWSNSVLRNSQGQIQYIVSTGIDITEQEAAKQALVEREEKLRSLFDYAQDAIFLCELTETGTLSNYTNVNKAGCEKLGYTLDELKAMSPQTIPVLEENKRQEALNQSKENGKATFTLTLLARDGTPVPFEFNVHAFKYYGRSLSLAIARDITERLRIEKELRESEERARLLVELSPDAIHIHQDDRIVYANPATARILGAENVQQLLGLDFMDFILPEYRDRVRQRIESIYSTGLPTPFMEQKYRRMDGSTVDVEVTESLYSYQGKSAIQVISRDITERKKMEQDALTADKLQSVGNLAGTIAHEYNNLLTVILGNLSVARMHSKKDGKDAEVLNEAENAAKQARDLTQRLLTFARGGQPVKQLVNLRKLLFKACNNIFNGEHISCRIDVPGDLYMVEADEGQICQVMGNIFLNAVQAMPDGGSVEIYAENISSEIPPHPSLAGGMYVKITVTDEGHGIPKDQLSSIFDPFYTTKPEGSGLGLATAYSVIKKHGGLLTVGSEEGQGATFTIYLPALNSKTRSEDEPAALTGSGRILLMDDEASIRRTAKEMLMLLGYDVTVAAEGQEVLSLYSKAKEAGQPFQLIILDLVVKEGLGGKETMEALLALDLNSKVLVSSGYSNDPVMSNYKAYGFCGCVPKPYTIEQLGQALERAVQSM